jgi:hypothetical protein
MDNKSTPVSKENLINWSAEIDNSYWRVVPHLNPKVNLIIKAL